MSNQNKGPICIRSGSIQVQNATDNKLLGFIAPTFYFEVYGYVTNDISQSLKITFPYDITTPFSITTMNGPNATFPFFGAIVRATSDSDNIGTNTSNYYFIGITAETSPNTSHINGSNSYTAKTTLIKAIESAIWSISSSKILTAQWINTDCSKPTTYIIYIVKNNSCL